MNRRAARKATISVLPLAGFFAWIIMVGMIVQPLSEYLGVSQGTVFVALVLSSFLAVAWIVFYRREAEWDQEEEAQARKRGEV